MRVVLLILTLLLAGCASPSPADPTAGATPAGPPASSPAAPPAASPTVSPAAPPTSPPPAPSEEVFLGVVLDVTHDFASDGRQVRTFNVTGGESKVVIHLTGAGPPADGSFTSAVVQFYFPSSTSPFLGELPGQRESDFTTEQQPHRGTWRVVFDGEGKTSASVRVTLQ